MFGGVFVEDLLSCFFDDLGVLMNLFLFLMIWGCLLDDFGVFLLTMFGCVFDDFGVCGFG